MLSENTYYSSLPDEGTPEEHEGSGGLHPEEVEGGPLIPEGWILDFRTRRLVPFVLPDDPDAENLPAAPPRGGRTRRTRRRARRSRPRPRSPSWSGRSGRCAR
jgi:hypothetical protein